MNHRLLCRFVAGLLLVAIAHPAATETAAADNKAGPPTTSKRAAVVRDAKQIGGEPDGIVQVANLVYAGTKSSRCFSDLQCAPGAV